MIKVQIKQVNSKLKPCKVSKVVKEICCLYAVTGANTKS